ncbi:PHP domain-containing protein [Candidatus Woesearchaeota archaeon]|nr:PHP domain-containing protein [Candidatus Woesearchaeota archaeon]MBW3021863.1 PHP domain-containing protein [Candidatus Woesearchaeota archaeon]
MLKADFHMHTNEDPIDFCLGYSAKELIKYCAKLKYKVLAITNHAFKPSHRCFFNRDIESYAKKQGILLIPGMEARIDNKDVVLLNIKPGTKKPCTFRRVEMLRDEGAMVMAPHPMFKLHSLNNYIFKKIKLFDAIEYSHNYTKYFNMNNQGMEIADEYNLPLVGTSDCHYLSQLDKTYTMVDAALNKDSVLEAIRKKKVRVVTRPLKTREYVSIMSRMFFKDLLLKTFLEPNGHAH